MDVNLNVAPSPDESGGCSVILGEKVLSLAQVLDLPEQWKNLGFGNVSHRKTAYTTCGTLVITIFAHCSTTGARRN